jgi:CheY-like chemotaxis protein
MSQGNVLIIDNNTEALKDLKEVFESRGYRVFTATTVKSAMFRVRTLQINGVEVQFALVSDRLPGPMGGELSKYIAERLGVDTMKLVSPTPEQPAVDYEDIIKEYHKEMKAREIKEKHRVANRNTVSDLFRRSTWNAEEGFWTFHKGPTKVES